MRDLVGAERLSTVLLAPLVLAVSANTYLVHKLASRRAKQSYKPVSTRIVH